MGLTAVAPHTSTATAATPPLTLQQVISTCTSSETATDAAKMASVKTKHCSIPSPLCRPSSSHHQPQCQPCNPHTVQKAGEGFSVPFLPAQECRRDYSVVLSW